MDFVSDVADYGDAPEIYVSGTGRVTRISKSVVRLTMVSEREVDRGQMICRAVVHLIFDGASLHRDLAALRDALSLILAEAPLRDGDRERSASH